MTTIRDRLGLAPEEAVAISLAAACAAFAALDGTALFLVLPALSATFGASVSALSDAGSVLALGAVGGLPLAALADRSGRRRLLLFGVAGLGLANAATAVAPSLALLVTARLVAAAFEGMTASVATAFALESVRARSRGVAVAAVALGAGAGQGVTTLLYPLLAPSWRPLYAAGAAGVVAVPLMARWLREPPVWIGARPRSLAGLASDPGWRRSMAVLGASALLIAVQLSPATLFTALYAARQLGMTPAAISGVVIASGIAAASGYAGGGFLSRSRGRRVPAAALAVAGALVAGAAFTGGRAAFVGANIAWSLVAGAGAPFLAAWIGELLPTRARAGSEAALAVIAVAGGVAGLQAVAHLERSLGLGLAIAALTVPAVAGSALLLLLPETRGRPLPE